MRLSDRQVPALAWVPWQLEKRKQNLAFQRVHDYDNRVKESCLGPHTTESICCGTVMVETKLVQPVRAPLAVALLSSLSWL